MPWKNLMASIWLEPIVHETTGYHSDPIKLRRPLQVSQIRIAKPDTAISQLEFLAKNLRLPSDELVSIEKLERVEPMGNDVQVALDEPILTNYILVKGEFKNLSLCLEASEATLKHENITLRPVNSNLDRRGCRVACSVPPRVARSFTVLG